LYRLFKLSMKEPPTKHELSSNGQTQISKDPTGLSHTEESQCKWTKNGCVSKAVEAKAAETA